MTRLLAKKWAIGTLAAGLIVVAVEVKLHQAKPSKPAPTGQTSTAQTKEPAGPAHDTTPTTTPTNQTAKPQTATGTTPPTGSLPRPTGQLLNKHTISLGSTDEATSPSEQSACQTQVGANCDIKLTGPNGEVKTLGAKNVDGNGSVIFDWNAKTLDLTPGKWKVEAVATKDGLSGTSSPDYLQVNS